MNTFTSVGYSKASVCNVTWTSTMTLVEALWYLDFNSVGMVV